jgi:ribonuclease D
LPPVNIFDTQIAAGFVGLPQFPVSYARLVEALTGVRLGKTETRSEWDRRPLTPEQIRYAKDDVRYLLDIRNKLGKVIEKLGRQIWMTEEMERFSDPALYAADPEEVYLKIRGSRSGFGARQTGHLRALAAWREREAAEQNVPPRSMLRDDTLVELALRPPSHLNDFRRIKSFPVEESTTIGPKILAELLAVRRLSESELPAPLSGQNEQETPAQKAFADLAYALATIHCQSNHLAPELVITRAAVLDLTLCKTNASLLSGWRNEIIGAFLERLLQGNVDVRVHVDKGVPQWVPVEPDSPNPGPSLVGKGEG